MAYIGQKPIPVPAGGTGQSTLTNHGVLVGAGTAAITQLAVGVNGTLFRGNTGADPVFASTCTGSFTFTSATAGTMRVLGVSNTNNSNTGSSSTFSAAVGGTSSGDPMLQHIVTSVTTWSQGTDNSVTSPEADPYVISAGSTLGTNDVMRIQPSGLITYPLQSAFLAYLGTSDANVTGNGATYTLGSGNALTEIFDQHGDFNTNGTYTCPITSRVDLRAVLQFANTTSPLTFTGNIVTSNRTYSFIYTRAAGLSANQSVLMSAIVDMDIADTATITGIITGEVGNTASVLGSSTLVTYFCGIIAA